jgi:N-acetyl-anhydromuramyl-L-alanine amidase AmpD
MYLDRIIRKILKEEFKSNFIFENELINDISSISTYPPDSLLNDKYFVIHHTAGYGSAQQVINVLNSRTLGIQYVIDREGKIYKTTKGTKGAHITSQYPGKENINNDTARGVEIVAKNNDDVTLKQCRSALMLVKELGYSLSQIYGHGEVSSNKTRDEGQKCKNYFKINWNKNYESLPVDTDNLYKKLPEFTITAKKK